MAILGVRDLPRHVGEEATVQGWLYNLRSKGKIHFLQVRDGTGIVQGVVGKGDVPDDVFAACEGIPQESSVVVTGTVRADARAPGGVELHLTDVRVIQRSEPYPIALQSHGPDFLLRHRHLWLRSRKPWATLRVRHQVIRAIRDFFDSAGFTNVDAPIFTPAACEGTTTLFEVKYFDEGNAYLTQSGQLYIEAAAMSLGKVYCFGPVFRAERSKTRKHLTEFWMVEPEVAYATLPDIMDLAEGLIVAIATRVLDACREELKVLERDPAPIEKVVKPFPRLTHAEAVARVNAKGVAMARDDDFGAPQEEALVEGEERPVMVYRWPSAVKAFYMKRDPADPSVALGVDVIAPEGYGEVIGGGQREDDLAKLLERIEAEKLPKEAFEWYLDLRRYGSVPHGGFGLGLERTVQWMCGTEHIRETAPFPRMMYRIYP